MSNKGCWVSHRMEPNLFMQVPGLFILLSSTLDGGIPG